MDNKMSYDDAVKHQQQQQHEITRSTSVDPPAHYTFQIKSYSALSEIGMKQCESGEFEVDGYNWKLILYPNGDEKVEDHISLYLALTSKDNLPLGGEVRVIFRFFVYDQIKDNYLIIQDGKMRKYSKRKSEHGFTHFLSHDDLNKASNGFIEGNCCTFGVEVSIIKPSNKGESLTIIKDTQHDYFFWAIFHFSKKLDESYVSEPFNVKGRKWRMMVYPKGLGSGKMTHVSVYLKLDNSETFPAGKKIYAKYFLDVYNFEISKYVEKSNEHWFSDHNGHGFDEFLSQKDLDSHLKNDRLCLKARIVAMSTVEDF